MHLEIGPEVAQLGRTTRAAGANDRPLWQCIQRIAGTADQHIGGIGTLPGPIIGVLVFYGLQRLLSDYGTVYLIILGIIGIAIMLFERRGLWGGVVQKTGFDFLPLEHLPPKPRLPRLPVFSVAAADSRSAAM